MTSNNSVFRALLNCHLRKAAFKSLPTPASLTDLHSTYHKNTIFNVRSSKKSQEQGIIFVLTNIYLAPRNDVINWPLLCGLEVPKLEWIVGLTFQGEIPLDTYNAFFFFSVLLNLLFAGVMLRILPAVFRRTLYAAFSCLCLSLLQCAITDHRMKCKVFSLWFLKEFV